MTNFLYQCQAGSNSWLRTETQIVQSVAELIQLNPLICIARHKESLAGLCISVSAAKLESQLNLEQNTHYFCELAVLPALRRQGIAEQLIRLSEESVGVCSRYIADVKPSSNSQKLFSKLSYEQEGRINLVRCTKAAR